MTDSTNNRDRYSWGDLTSDLALSTSLTLDQAHKLTWPLQESSVHPFDALPHLIRLHDDDPEVRGHALVQLIALKPESAK